MTHGLRRLAPVLAALTLAAVTTAVTGCGGDDDNGTGPTPTLELQSGSFSNGQVYSHAFMTARTYTYKCSIHSGMTGEVIVSATAPASDSVATVNIPGVSFTPSSVTIAVNGRVRWTNNDNTAHTVTSTN